MAHTPGPWFVNDDCIEAGGPEGPRDMTLAVVQGHPHNACRAANARLIAAAPALLAALQMAKNELVILYEAAYPDDESDNDVTDAIDAAITAIAQAEGRSE